MIATLLMLTVPDNVSVPRVAPFPQLGSSQTGNLGATPPELLCNVVCVAKKPGFVHWSFQVAASFEADFVNFYTAGVLHPMLQ
jgi:hypothetical protein